MKYAGVYIGFVYIGGLTVFIHEMNNSERQAISCF